jgi:hypothetical protein
MLKSMTKRQVLAAGALSLLGPRAFAAASRPVVAELFTSQGCSSCPPADAIFEDLAGERDVVALTYHVDYWDYLGWRDTLGSKEFSQRQYDYAKSRGDMDVYTPQAIVNGKRHVVGSKKSVLASAIEAAAGDASENWVDFSIESHGSDMTIRLPETSGIKDATLWLLAVTTAVEVSIERGENAGSKITYRNVVRKMSPAAMWNGEAAKIMMPRSTTLPGGEDQCAALLQIGKAGPVIGAALLRDLS